MRKLIIFLALIIGAGVSASAQTQKTADSLQNQAEIKADSLMKVALQQAGATTSEINQIFQIKENYVQQVKMVRNDGSLTASQQAEEIKQLSEQKNILYKQVLGVTKYREYNRIKNELHL